MTPDAFTVEPRGRGLLGRRYVILCSGVVTHECRDKGAAEKFAAVLNGAYGLGFLDGRSYAMKEAAEILKSSPMLASGS